ncbi:DNA pilot protein [robinz microvirus RP_71]|nr:DNA pilot protein [robinz microvirus RP_71]
MPYTLAPGSNPTPGTGSTPSTGSTWIPWLNLGLQAASSYANYTSAQKANRTNVNLTREQRAWDEMMSNTAVQRRADDIERAGGNRALAFTNSAEASTPNVQPARVEAPQFNAPQINTASLLAKAQLANIQADTRGKNASASSNEVDARIKNALEVASRETQSAQFNQDWQRRELTNQILKNQEVSSAADANRLKQTVDAMVDKAVAEAKKGTLDATAMENISKIYGLEAGRAAPIIQAILKALGVFK